MSKRDIKHPDRPLSPVAYSALWQSMAGSMLAVKAHWM
jgi:hypothetical protein